MSKFKVYFIALAALSVLFSCDDKNSAQDYEILHEFGTQRDYDMEVIKQYLKNHYIAEIIDNPGGIDDQDIKLERIPANGTQESIWESEMLDSVHVERHSLTYTIFYIKQREGTGDTPSRVDRVFASYDGSYLRMDDEPTRFEYVQNPTSYIPLHSTIAGWPEVFRLFKDGPLMDTGEGNPAAYENFGAGVMFLPSGLAYFNMATPNIPPYAQLMFKFKLFDVKRDDQDGDGILSNDEDLNNDGIFTNDDTDGDGIPNFVDNDDDGDGYLTRNENKKPVGFTGIGASEYFPFNPIADDPLTPINETEEFGVPNCAADLTNPQGNADNFNNASRTRKYLDKNCH